MSTPIWDAWNYRESAEWTDRDRSIVGFSVHATDGDIGKVDDATTEVGSSYIVVDTGPWIFGRKVMLPAGTIDRIDWDDEKVYVDRSKDQVKDSPEFTDVEMTDPAYRERLGTYYGETYDRGAF
jgi:hypothetical protein